MSAHRDLVCRQRRRRLAPAIHSIAKPKSAAGALLDELSERGDVEQPKTPCPCTKAPPLALPPAPDAEVLPEPPVPAPVVPLVVPVVSLPVLLVPVPVPVVPVPVELLLELLVEPLDVDVFWMHWPIDMSIEVHWSPVGQPFPPVPRHPMMQVFVASSQTIPDMRPPQSESFRHMTHVFVVGSHCRFDMHWVDVVHPSHFPALGPVVAQIVERQTVMPLAPVHGPSPFA